MAKGDIIARLTSGVSSWLGVGSNGQVLTADSAQTLGVKWAAAAGGAPTGSAGGSLAGTYPNPSLSSQNLTDIAALTDPNVDKILFWDDSAGAYKLLTVGTNLTITGTTIDASGGGGAGIGSSALVYRYTVTGSDKASIDTGVDTPDAGSNDWTNGDLLEIFLYVRTDDAINVSDIGVIFNNDTGAKYFRQRLRAVNTTVSAAVEGGTGTGGTSGVLASVAGASTAANRFSAVTMTVPNFSGTVGYKEGTFFTTNADTTAANDLLDIIGFTFADTTAITRAKFVSAVSGKKLKVGTKVLIYKRLAS